MSDTPILFEELPAGSLSIGRVTLSVAATLNSLTLPFGASAALVLALFLMVNSMNYSRPGETENIANQIAQQNPSRRSESRALRAARW